RPLRKPASGAASRLPGSGRAGRASLRAIRLHAAQVAGLRRAGHRREHALSPLAAPGKPGPAAERMARRRQAQQAFLQALRLGQDHPETVGGGVGEHEFILERNCLMTTNELLDRYVHAVGFWLPKKQKADIMAELTEDLRSQIEEKEAELGRKLALPEVECLLKMRGRPVLVANHYLPQQY